MVSFAQPLFWQIKYIVAALSKKNQKHSLNELHNLVAAFGYDAQVFFLRVLLEEAAQSNWSSSGRGSLQLQVLSQELKEIEHEEQFGQLLCHAIEQFKENFTEDFLFQLCKNTKISLQAQFQLAVAMLQSLPTSHEASRREAAKFLRNRFRDLPSHKQARFSESLVHALLALLKGCPQSEVQEVFEDKERDLFFKQVLDQNPDIDTTKGPLAGLLVLYKMRESRLKQHARKVIEMPILASGEKSQGHQDGVRACDLIEELGHHGGSSSAQAVRETLKEFPMLDARGVAEVVAVALHFSEKVDSNAMLVANLATATALSKEGANHWNSTEMTQQIWHERQPQTAPQEALSVETVMESLASHVKGIQKSWEEVFDVMFDLPELRLPNKKAVEALVSAFNYVCPNADFPLEAVLRLRRNTAAQLQFIKHAVSGLSLPLKWFKYKSLEAVSGLPGAEGGPNTAGPGNCWNCLKLLEVLFELAEVEDYVVVQRLFTLGCAMRPHAMFLACCRAEDRSRQMMRSDILEKLAPPLFEPNGGPNALLATVALARSDPAVLKKLLKAMLEKDPANLQKILHLLTNESLKDFHADLLREAPSELVCQIVLASQAQPMKHVVNLSNWLRKVLSEHKDTAAFSLIRFLKARLQSDLPGQPATSFKPPVPLPAHLDEVDVARSFLEALNQAMEMLNPEAARQVRELESLAFQRHPQLAPVASKPPEAAPQPPNVPPPTAPPPPPTAVPAPPSMPVPPPVPERQPERGDPARIEEDAQQILHSLFERRRTPKEVCALLKEYSKKEDKHQYKHVFNKTIELISSELPKMYTYPSEMLEMAIQLAAGVLDMGLLGIHENAVLKSITNHLMSPASLDDLHFQLSIVNRLLDRVARWPLLCLEMSRMQELVRSLPPLQSYVSYAKRIIDALPEELRASTRLPTQELQRLHELHQIPNPPQLESIKDLDGNTGQYRPGSLHQYIDGNGRAEAGRPGAQAAARRDIRQNPPSVPPPNPTPQRPKATPAPQRPLTVDQLLNEPEVPIPTPSQTVQDAVASVFNSLSQDNIGDKVSQLERSVTANDYRWLCYYTVSRRAAREANFHQMYITFFSACKDKKILFQQLIIMTFECLRLMMKAVDEAVNSANHRSVLKSLGSWLGLITIGRDQPLKSKSMDIKDLLLDAYENSRLTAVLPMACKILEAVGQSRAFKLPSPWTMGLLMLVAEIHAIPNLRTNLMFEVEVLFRHLELEIAPFHKSDLLRTRRAPQGGPDLSATSTRMQEEMPSAQRQPYVGWSQGEPARPEVDYRAYVQPQQLYPHERERHRAVPQAVPQAHTAQSQEEQYITVHLTQLLQIPPQFTIFHQRGRLVRWLTMAVDKAVKEVIPAVDASVHIACFSSGQMALKDFIYEIDEALLQKAAYFMGLAVSGSLALVMCKEPLRLALTSHLWHLFMSNYNTKDMSLMDAQVMETMVNILVEKNMELCSILVEKYVNDKALEDVERIITCNMDLRVEHKARYPHTMFYDSTVSQSPWLQQIPEHLRPNPGTLSPMFLKIYKDFHAHYAAYQQRLPQGLQHERLNIPERRYPSGPADQHYYYFQKQKDMHLRLQQQQFGRGMMPAGQMDRQKQSQEMKDQASQLLGKISSLVIQLQDSPLRLSSLSNIPFHLHCTDETLEAVAALSNLHSECELRKVFRGAQRWVKSTPVPDELFMKIVKQIFQSINQNFSKAETMQTRPDCISGLHAATEVWLCTLDILAASAHHRKLLSETLLTRLDDMESNGYLQLDVIAGFLRYRLVAVSELDRMMARWMESRMRTSTQVPLMQLDFVLAVLQRCCLDHRTHFGKDFMKSGDMVTKFAERKRRMGNAPPNAVTQPQETQLLTRCEHFSDNINAQTHMEEEYIPIEQRSPSKLCVTTHYATKDAEEKPPKVTFDADWVAALLTDWHKAVQTNSDTPPSLDHMGNAQNRQVGTLLQKITQYVLSSNTFHEDNLELFFKYCCDFTVKQAEAVGRVDGRGTRAVPLDFAYVDSFSYLIVAVMKKPHDPSGRFIDRPFSYNQQALPVLRCTLQAIHKALAQAAKSQGKDFNQRVWYRLLLNIMVDTVCNGQDMSWKIVQAFADTFLALNPMRVPSFAFAWLDLISHKMFMPRILAFPARRGWLSFQRIFMGLLNYIGPYLARIRMSDLIRNLYKCTLRTLLVLLHDFPEFLSDYHMVFCDVIPWQCVQIRNLILAAFPSTMKLPDPFTHSLKVDTLPEMKVGPNIQSTYVLKLMTCGLKADIDVWIRTSDQKVLESIKNRLLFSDPQKALEVGTKYNVPLLNAAMLYTGSNAFMMQVSRDTSSPSLTLFQYLLEQFDTEGRFLMFTTFANHLRFPNMHTYCFSCILLWIFHQTAIVEVREQITRVLLERLIVHRPHPWGLLITFIELIKNSRYNFWNYPFVKADQQLQKLFTSVAFTCLGNPVPGDGDPVDTPEAQLRYLQTYRFNEATHQQYRLQQIDVQQAQMRAQQAAAQAQAPPALHAQAMPQQAPPQLQPPAQAPPAQAPPAPQLAPPQEAPPPQPPQGPAKPKVMPANVAGQAAGPKIPPPSVHSNHLEPRPT